MSSEPVDSNAAGGAGRRFFRGSRTAPVITLGLDGRPHIPDDPMSGIVGGSEEETAEAANIVEAARLDGVGGWKMFRYITVPRIRPSLIVVLTTILVHALVGHPGWAVLVASRVLGLPIVAGLAYEAIRFAGRGNLNR